MKLTAVNLFQDNMVLQREKPVRIWGTAEPCATISVSIYPIHEPKQKKQSTQMTSFVLTASSVWVTIVLKGADRYVYMHDPTR